MIKVRQDAEVPERWRIRLLGALAVQVDGGTAQAVRWRLSRSRAVVAMLALAPGQACRRDEVLDRLWPDLSQDAAARNLHQTLYVARRTLASVGVASDGVLALRADRVVLDSAGPIPTDVSDFEELAGASLIPGGESKLSAALEMYTGDLVPDLVDAPWLTSRREELRETFRALTIKQAGLLTQHSPEEALLQLAPILEADPLHEGAVRLSMLALAAAGRRSAALARYERLVVDLLEAFGTDPDPETKGVFRELLTTSLLGTSPMRTTDSRDELPGSLPIPVTSLVGREREIADVERILSRTRLCTLTGAGGCGKTRLALEVASRARGRHADGVWFVDLSPVLEAALVGEVVASVLGLDAGSAPDRMHALVDQLRRRAMLIVLDNCEHLLAACAHLAAELLAGCPLVVVLATSRAPLHTYGEYTFPVPSLVLPAPDRGEPPDLLELGRLSSVRLFLERAAQARSGFALTPENATAVAELCRRLDGLPLAVELAAARTSVLEPAEIVGRLGDALDLLQGSSHRGTRHETLRGTLEWSHQLLTEPEQILLRRLAIFSGGFTLDAIEAVCADASVSRRGILDLLTALVDQSLVAADNTPVGTRYRQLETVRQYGREHLLHACEEPTMAQAHCAYFLAWAAARNPEHAIGVVIERPRHLDREHDNLRAALQWSCAHDPETGLGLAASLWRFWFVRGYAVEGARWVERALAASPEPSRPRAAALLGLAGLDSRQGRGDRHRTLGAEALAVTREIGEPDEVVAARLAEATLAWSVFAVEEAEQRIRDVRAEAEHLSRPELVAAASWMLAQCALTREDGVLAATQLDACLVELRACEGITTAFLPVVTPSVQLVTVAGRLVPSFEETLLLGRRAGSRQAGAYVLSALGDAARLRGDSLSATSDIVQAVEEFRGLGDDLARGQVTNQLGCVLREAGEHAQAMATFTEARRVRRAVGDRRGVFLTELHLALSYAMTGDVEAGRARAHWCLRAFESAGDHVGMGAALMMLATIELVAVDLRSARELYGWAAEQLTPWRRHAAWARLMVAELSVEMADTRRAEREAIKSAAAFQGVCRIAAARLGSLPGTPGPAVEHSVGNPLRPAS